MTMSSYVAVAGKPTGDSVCIFGLTPQEVRYLQVQNLLELFALSIFKKNNKCGPFWPTNS